MHLCARTWSNVRLEQDVSAKIDEFGRIHSDSDRGTEKGAVKRVNLEVYRNVHTKSIKFGLTWAWNKWWWWCGYTAQSREMHLFLRKFLDFFFLFFLVPWSLNHAYFSLIFFQTISSWFYSYATMIIMKTMVNTRMTSTATNELTLISLQCRLRGILAHYCFFTSI